MNEEKKIEKTILQVSRDYIIKHIPVYIAIIISTLFGILISGATFLPRLNKVEADDLNNASNLTTITNTLQNLSNQVTILNDNLTNLSVSQKTLENQINSLYIKLIQ